MKSNSEIIEKESIILRGGVLADEMGLGKTIMVLSTILLNPYKKSTSVIADNPSKKLVCKATLIITPASILHQWAQESKKNVQGLKVMIYDGKKNTDGEFQTCNELMGFHVILISYQTLAREIHAAQAGRTSARRYHRRVERRVSPLVQFHFWRVVLDEAQMVENGISNASGMARMISRELSWVVTGTPCPKTGKIEDMDGLFQFLEWPIVLHKHFFSLPRDVLHQVIKPMFHRNTKVNVREQLRIPPQTDHMFFLSFSPIEFQFYSDLVDDGVDDIGVKPPQPDLEGLNPMTVLKYNRKYETALNMRAGRMQSWFFRLRQVCCHPRASTAANRNIGAPRSRIQTMNQVLDSMIERSSTLVSSLERNLVDNKLRNALILDKLLQFDEALTILLEQRLVCEAKIQSLKREVEGLERRRKELEGRDGLEGVEETSEEEQELEVVIDSIQRGKMNLRLWFELEHEAVFFTAWHYVETLDSEREREYFGIAQRLRDAMLMEYENAFIFHRNLLESTWVREFLPRINLKLKFFFFDDSSNLHISFQEVAILYKLLADQWDLLMDWFSNIKRLSCLPLDLSSVEEDGVTGEEFNQSFEIQEKISIYHRELIRLLDQRMQSLVAEPKTIARCDTCSSPFQRSEQGVNRTATRIMETEFVSDGRLTPCLHKFCEACRGLWKVPKHGRIDCPVCYETFEVKELQSMSLHHCEFNVATQKRFRDRFHDVRRTRNYNEEETLSEFYVLEKGLAEKCFDLVLPAPLNSFKSFKEKFLSLETSQELTADEQLIARQIYDDIDNELDDQIKRCAFLKEYGFRFNISELLLDILQKLELSRGVYYDQLQRVSDSIEVPTFSPHLPSDLSKCIEEYSGLEQKLSSETGRYNYLKFLHTHKGDQDSSHQTCTVCTETIIDGFLTECGHISCSDCARKWLHRHLKCHVCNTPVVRAKLTPITFQPPPKKISLLQKTESGYSQHIETLAKIPLNESYGTKIDAIIRHIHLLKSKDTLVKVLIFSQWAAVLQIFRHALLAEGIGYIALEGNYWGPVSGKGSTKKGTSVKIFGDTDDLTCFFLHAKSQSSGLNLVCATHVFLVEPLLQKGLERQATGRVHRIGQTRATFVWRYLIQSSIEDYLVEAQQEVTEEGVKLSSRDMGEQVGPTHLEEFFGPLVAKKFD